MGLYNYVTDFSVNCPKCGDLIKDFQTKDSSLNTLYLNEVSFKTVNSFHTFCNKCHLWIDVKIKTRPIEERTKEDYDIITSEF